MKRPSFDHIVMGVIAINTVALIWSMFDTEHDEAFDMAHNLILGFFVVELIVKLAAAQWLVREFVRSPWNMFDLTVITLALLPVLPVGITLLRMARLARLAHAASRPAARCLAANSSARVSSLKNRKIKPALACGVRPSGSPTSTAKWASWPTLRTLVLPPLPVAVAT